MALTDPEKANITQLAFCLVSIALLVYYGWFRNGQDDSERSKYFAGALDAITFATHSDKAIEKKKAIVRAKAAGKAQRKADKEWEATKSAQKTPEINKNDNQIEKRESVKRASIAKRKSILEEVNAEVPQPTAAFKRNSIIKRTSLLNGNNMMNTDVETGNPVLVEEGKSTPSSSSDIKESTPNNAQLDDVSNVIAEQYTMDSHFYFDVHLMDDEIQTWPGFSHVCCPDEAENAFLLKSIRESSPRWYHVALNELKANANVLTQFGYTTLHEAFGCRSDDAICTDLCNDKVSNLARTSNGTTLLMKAIIADNLQAAAILIENGCDVDLQDVEGNTALMHGCMRGNPRCARFLLPYGADPHILNASGMRAVDLALLCGNARAATDIEGPTAVVVPGYVSTHTQTTEGAINLAYTVIRQFLDVASDILVAISFWQDNPTLSRAIIAFIALPSCYMALMPYQSIMERLVTILQLRVAYEALKSMGQEKTSVRFGAMEMIQTVLQNCPQLILQSLIIEHSVASSTSLSSTVLFSVAMSAYSSGETFKNMYLLRFNLPEDPDADVATYDMYGIICTIYSVIGIIIRAVFWAVLLSSAANAIGVTSSSSSSGSSSGNGSSLGVISVGIYVFLTRLRLISMNTGNEEDLTKLHLTGIDIAALFLTDLPFSPNCQQFQFAELLTFLENTAVIWNCASKSQWFNSLIIFAVASFFKEYAFLTLVHSYIHGSSFQNVNIEFLKEFFLLRGLKEYLVDCKNTTWKSIKKTIVYYKRQYRYQRRLFGAWYTEQGYGSNDSERLQRNKEFLKLHRKKKSALIEAKLTQNSGMSEVEGQHKSASVFETYTTFNWNRIKLRDTPPLFFLVSNIFFLIVFFATDSCTNDSRFCGSNDDANNNNNVTSYNNTGLECCTLWGLFATKWTIPLTILFYVASLYEALKCPIGRALRACFPAERCYDYYLAAVGSMNPVLQWRSISYHYETRTDKDGKTTQEKVITRDVTDDYDYDFAIDNSGKFDYTGRPFVQVLTTSSYTFHDSYTTTDYNTKREQFYVDNDVDTYQDKIDSTYFGDNKATEILEPMLLYAHGRLYFLQFTYYVYAIVLSLSFFFRWFVNSITADMTIGMTKVIVAVPPEYDDEDSYIYRVKYYMEVTKKEIGNNDIKEKIQNLIKEE